MRGLVYEVHCIAHDVQSDGFKCPAELKLIRSENLTREICLRDSAIEKRKQATRIGNRSSDGMWLDRRFDGYSSGLWVNDHHRSVLPVDQYKLATDSKNREFADDRRV